MKCDVKWKTKLFRLSFGTSFLCVLDALTDNLTDLKCCIRLIFDFNVVVNKLHIRKTFSSARKDFTLH